MFTIQLSKIKSNVKKRIKDTKASVSSDFLRLDSKYVTVQFLQNKCKL